MRPLLLVAAALIGGCSWFALQPLLFVLPVPIRFLFAWILFTLGPGAGLGAWMTGRLDPLSRIVVLLGFGSAATPVLIDLAGRADVIAAFPFVATALGGAGVVQWRDDSPTRSPRGSLTVAAAAALVVALAFSTGAIAFGHRVTTTNGIELHGDYDSFDLSYYAAIASEATHTVPPTASFYSGHGLNAAYYPQLVVAMVHRFTGVPLLLSYFGYAWPSFLALGALTIFVLVREVASIGPALLTAVLTLLCGDFSYLAAWLLPGSSASWDYLLWPTNFLSPTMEVLHFNTWTPSLPMFFTALYAIVRGLRTGERGWMVASALLIAVLFQFKPFAYAVTAAALLASALFSGGDATARRRFAVTLILAALFSAPFLYGLTQLAGDQRSRLVIDYFLLPQRMLLKLDLRGPFLEWTDRMIPLEFLRRPGYLLAATALFFTGGLGVRWGGLPGVWRAITAPAGAGSDASSWRLLGWIVAVGIILPFVVATEPYQDTLQFYQTGLYVLWIFTAVAFTSFARAYPRSGVAGIALAIAVSLPSSVHYLTTKWTDNQQLPLVQISDDEVRIADYLQTFDPLNTVVLDDRPRAASLTAILSKRRMVLAWGHPNYAPASESRAQDVAAFYGSVQEDPAVTFDVLRRYHVTHVIVHHDRDRVHPDVLAQLQPLLQFPTVTLYLVPPATGT